MQTLKLYFNRENWSGQSGFLLVLLVSCGLLFTANDWLAIENGLLVNLGIPTSFLFAHADLIAFVLALTAWFMVYRKSLFIAGIVTWSICGVVPLSILKYSDREIQRIPISRWLEPDEFDALRNRFSFPISETANSSVSVICTSKKDDQVAEVTVELRQLGVLRPGQTP